MCVSYLVTLLKTFVKKIFHNGAGTLYHAHDLCFFFLHKVLRLHARLGSRPCCKLSITSYLFYIFISIVLFIFMTLYLQATVSIHIVCSLYLLSFVYSLSVISSSHILLYLTSYISFIDYIIYIIYRLYVYRLYHL